MEVNLYSFSKRNKSTKQALITDIKKTVDCQLKDKCTVENPILIFNFEPVGYNYVYIGKWNRYYFISGWQYSVGNWEVSLTEDYLASFKTAILSQYAIIAYAYNSNLSIVDKRIPVRSDIISSNINSASLSGVTWLTGNSAPILSITGKGSNGVYYVGYTDTQDLLDGVDTWFNDNVADFFAAVKQLFYGGSAANCIKNAIGLCWIPTDLYAGEQLVLGGYPCRRSSGTYISGYRVHPIETHSCNITIPWHYSDWRKSSPYTEIKMFLPLVGNVTISSEAAKNDSSLDVTYAFNNTSGEVNIKVIGHSSGIIMQTATASGASSIHIGSSNVNAGKITTSVGAGLGALVAGAATLLTGGAVAPALLGIGGGLASAAGGTLSGLGGTSEGGGGLGGGSAIALGTNITCQVISRVLTDDPANFAPLMGKPLFKNDILSNYYGYVQTEGYQFAGICSSAEKDAINSLLDSGIYIE